MSQLQAILPFGPDERCVGHANGSRVAISLHRHAQHRMRREFFASRSADDVRRATIHSDAAEAWETLKLKPLKDFEGFDALRDDIRSLQQRYRAAPPLVVHVRMDAYPEMSCALWGLADEIRQVISRLELVQPAPPPDAQASVDEDVTQSRRCGYAFFRGSSAARIPPTMNADNQTIQLCGLNVSGFQGVKWDVVHGVKVETAARRLAMALRLAGADCLHLDVAAGSSTPLVDALMHNGIRAVAWEAPKRYPPVRSPPWLHPRPKPMAENLLRLYYARHARLFLVERGTCWGDVVTMIRSHRRLPTLTMQATASGELRLEGVPRSCVRTRGTCVDTTKRFPYRRWLRPTGVC
jgi:hypothetical protein